MSELIGGPGNGDYEAFRAADNDGKICLFAGHSKSDVETQHGVSTVADCQLVIVLEDNFKDYDEYSGWVFGQALAPAIYRSERPVVVGRLSKQKTKNGREAWMLSDLAEGELAAVRSWFTENVVHADGKFAIKDAEAPF